MGVPEPIQPVVDKLAGLFMNEIADMMPEFGGRETVFKNPEASEDFPVKRYEMLTEIKPVMTLGDFSQFKISGGTGTLNKYEGGYLIYINVSLHATLSTLMRMTRNFEPGDKLYDDIFEEVRSVVAHELTHVYEAIRRRATKSKKPSELLGSAAADYAYTSSQVAKLDIPDDLSFLFHLIYVQAKHEVGARVPQIQSLIRKTDPNKRMDLIKKTDPYMEAVSLKDFDAQKTYDAIIKKIIDGHWELKHERITRDAAVKVLDKLFHELERNFMKGHDMLYTNTIKDMDPDVASQVQKSVASHLKGIHKIESMSALEFMKYWEKKFHYAGEKLYRKILKLATY
jgi:hypothetical protein